MNTPWRPPNTRAAIPCYLPHPGDTSSSLACLHPGPFAKVVFENVNAQMDIRHYYQRYGAMVFRRCRQLLKDDEKAADAMHDVFVQFIGSADRVDPRAPASLLNRIATNVCLNRIRGDAYRSTEPDSELLHTLADSTDVESHSLASRILDRIFQREQTSTRALAVMHLVDGMTLEEVAEEVGLSVSGVRKRLRTLRGRVKHIQENET